MQSHSYENSFDLHENETACRTHFHMKGFKLRLVLKQTHKRICLILVLRHSNAKNKVIKGQRQKTVSQSKLKVRTFKARENVCERVAIGFGFNSSYFS